MAALVQRSTPPVRALTNTTPSQNTAPVLEYRCMFTHDGHKKAKKWHDGTLRFHTFNKRVMVYDDSKSLVGGLHYRAQEEFSEGLEFRLDRPIDVVVEEKLGQTSTDLTPLLAKENRPPSHHNSAQLAHPSSSRLSAANPHAKPKSIREVLGASQGQIGRPRIPLQQSPFDLRKSRLDTQAPEPPAKRRRLDTQPRVVTHPPTSVESPVVVISSQTPVEEQVNEHSSTRSVHDVGARSGANSIMEVTHSVTPIASRRAGIAKDARLQRLHPTAQRAADRAPIVQTSIPVAKPSPKIGSRTNRHSRSYDTVVQSENSEVTRRLCSPPQARKVTPFRNRAVLSSTARLKFRIEPPRRKLMYKALLPSRIQSASAPAALQSNHPLACPPSRRRPPPLYEFDKSISATQTQSQDVSAEPGVPVQTALGTDKLHSSSYVPLHRLSDGGHSPPNEGRSRSPPGSPMFISQDAPQSMLEEIQEEHEDDFEIPLLTQEDQDPASVLSESQSQRTKNDPAIALHKDDANDFRDDQDIQSDHDDDDHDDNTTHNVDDVSAQRTLVLEEALHEFPCVDHSPRPRLSSASAHHIQISSSPQPLLQPLSLPTPPPQKRHRPFRRVFSEHATASKTPRMEETTGSVHSEPEDTHQTQAELTSLTDDADRAQHQHSIKSSTPPPLLRKSTSDTAALHRVIKEPPNPLPSSVPPRAPPIAQHHPSEPPDETQTPCLELEKPAPSHPRHTHDHNPKETAVHALSTTTITINTNTDMNIGPWTPTESFLLFPRWPPHRPKPDYGQSTSTSIPVHTGLQDADTATNQRYGDPARLKRNLVAKRKYGTFGSAKLVSQT